MHCLRCGREAASRQAFCFACQEEMARYPVKPGTVVRIPTRKQADPARKSARKKKREESPEELLPILKKRIRRLRLTVALLALLLCAALVGAGFAYKFDPNIALPNIGQNYQTAETSHSTTGGNP